MIIRSIVCPERLDGAASLRCKVQFIKPSLTTDTYGSFIFPGFHYSNPSELYLSSQAGIFSFF